MRKALFDLPDTLGGKPEVGVRAAGADVGQHATTVEVVQHLGGVPDRNTHKQGDATRSDRAFLLTIGNGVRGSEHFATDNLVELTNHKLRTLSDKFSGLNLDGNLVEAVIAVYSHRRMSLWDRYGTIGSKINKNACEPLCMVSTSDDVKRYNIASKLADVKFLQELLIGFTQNLLKICDIESCTLNGILEEDRRNAARLENAIFQYGITSEAEPSETLARSIAAARAVFADEHLDLCEKLAELEALKHQMVLLTELVHGAAQSVCPHLAMTLAPVERLGHESRLHQSRLRILFERASARALTGSSIEDQPARHPYRAAVFARRLHGPAVEPLAARSE